MLAAAKSGVELAVAFDQRSMRIDIARCAETAGYVSQRHLFGTKLVIAVSEKFIHVIVGLIV